MYLSFLLFFYYTLCMLSILVLFMIISSWDCAARADGLVCFFVHYYRWKAALKTFMKLLEARLLNGFSVTYLLRTSINLLDERSVIVTILSPEFLEYFRFDKSFNEFKVSHVINLPLRPWIIKLGNSDFFITLLLCIKKASGLALRSSVVLMNNLETVGRCPLRKLFDCVFVFFLFLPARYCSNVNVFPERPGGSMWSCCVASNNYLLIFCFRVESRKNMYAFMWPLQDQRLFLQQSQTRHLAEHQQKLQEVPE